MHIFIVITRHSKEQYIKEQWKNSPKRRRAFKLKDWPEYRRLIEHEVDMERLLYHEIVNYVLEYLDIPNGAYRSSFMKYSMRRKKDRQMKDARRMIMADIQKKMIETTEFNEEMIEKAEATKILGFYEARKLDVLSILSNPFKHQFNNKQKFVVDLAVEQSKIEDQIYLKYGKEFRVFLKACHYYGLLKKANPMGKGEVAKDAVIIGNNFDLSF